MILEYVGKVDDRAQLRIYHKAKMDRELATQKGEEFIIRLEKKHKKRSAKQLRYLWKVVVEAVKEGYWDIGERKTKQQVYNELMRDFFFEEVLDEDTGVITQEPLNLASDGCNVTTKMFNERIEEMQQWASENLKIYIPDPGENLKMD